MGEPSCSGAHIRKRKPCERKDRAAHFCEMRDVAFGDSPPQDGGGGIQENVQLERATRIALLASPRRGFPSANTPSFTSPFGSPENRN